MIFVEKKEDCCGCAACVAACPSRCISVALDVDGFTFPSVDEKNCVSCGLCEKVCPILSRKTDATTANVANDNKQRVYAAYSLDDGIRFRGSSGGMFETFARIFLSEGGVVYGAAFDENLTLRTRRVESLEELAPLMKSKYLQCDCSSVYGAVKADLRAGRRVLYCAAPCQVAALKNYLRGADENLTTLDFFCHGVPSQDFFDRCRAYVEKKRRIKILSYQFRAKKKYGATPHYYRTRFSVGEGKREKTKTRLYLTSPFYNAFQQYITLRDSCYSCRFANRNRPADITIADFHTIERYVKGVDRHAGISTVVVNSARGETLWKSCADGLWTREFEVETLIANGECFAGPTVKPKKRERFLNDLRSKPFDDVIEEYCNPRKDWKKFVYYRMPKLVRDVLRKVVLGE